MGNCMQTCTLRQETGEMQIVEQQERSNGLAKEDGGGKNCLRLKVVLTKEELEWLVLQLNQKERKGLRQVLEEIERSRAKAEGWKPSLENILEASEMPELDT